MRSQFLTSVLIALCVAQGVLSVPVENGSPAPAATPDGQRNQAIVNGAQSLPQNNFLNTGRVVDPAFKLAGQSVKSAFTSPTTATLGKFGDKKAHLRKTHHHHHKSSKAKLGAAKSHYAKKPTSLTGIASQNRAAKVERPIATGAKAAFSGSMSKTRVGKIAKPLSKGAKAALAGGVSRNRLSKVAKPLSKGAKAALAGGASKNRLSKVAKPVGKGAKAVLGGSRVKRPSKSKLGAAKKLTKGSIRAKSATSKRPIKHKKAPTGGKTNVRFDSKRTGSRNKPTNLNGLRNNVALPPGRKNAAVKQNVVRPIANGAVRLATAQRQNRPQNTPPRPAAAPFAIPKVASKAAPKPVVAKKGRRDLEFQI